jgi:hypothetical protein
MVAWRGPSAFTGEPIQLILTGLDLDSENAKTGPMVQASIIRQDGMPVPDFGTERERAICGDCPLRGCREDGAWVEKRICYTKWDPFLLGQHMAGYEMRSPVEARLACAGKPVRVGTYGDPAAVPWEVWLEILAEVPTWTGYTHAWRTCDQRLKQILMASVETVDGYLDAMAKGWRTFRARLRSMPSFPHEIRCPAETPKRLKCVQCQLCAGQGRTAKNIVIVAHGQGASHLTRLVQVQMFGRKETTHAVL